MYQVLNQYIIPFIGVITSEVLFFSSYKLIKNLNKNIKFNPYPFILIFANCIGWIIVAIQIEDIFLYLANCGGIYISIWYILVSYENSSKETQLKILMVFMFFLVFWTNLGFFSIFIPLDIKEDILSMSATCITILMFSSPLFNIITIIKEKNSETINTPLTITIIINCTVWYLYGLFLKNFYIAIPNIIGLVLGLIQLLLIIIF